MTAPAPSTPELALRDAILKLLKADAGFQALAVKRIFDEVPASSGAAVPTVLTPYAYIGPMRRSELFTACGELWTVQARLYAVSTAFNRDQGWLLIDAMGRALRNRQQADLQLADPFSLQTPVEIKQAGDVIDPLQAKSVFLDLTTTIARGDDEEPSP